MSKEMTPKEAFKWLFLKASKQHGQLWAIKLTKPYGTRKKLVDEITSDLDNHGGELNDTFNIIEQALIELEFYKSFPQLQEASLIPEVNLKLVTCELQLRELKCDVKRYFDLGHIEEPSTEQFEEYLKLTEKLLKVGNEE